MLLGCLFLMGVHSTLFGPVKYAYLPQHLNEQEITGGNGMVEMGTFVAILLGQLAGGLLVVVPGIGPRAGRRRLPGDRGHRPADRAGHPGLAAARPAAQDQLEPGHRDLRNLKLARHDIVVFRSLLGISWMWFFGATFLSQFPSFAKDVLHGDVHVASLLLVLFSVGVGIGSLLCEVLSRRQVEIGLVPLGAIGMSVFAVDLYFAVNHLPAPARRCGPWPTSLARASTVRADDRPVHAVAQRRPLQRADVRADPDAGARQPPGPHHRRQQHPQRAVHDRQLADRGRAAALRREHRRRCS